MAAKNDAADDYGLSDRGGTARGPGKVFDPSAPSPAAAMAQVVRQPRPTRSRVPIPRQAFLELKQEARRKGAPQLDLQAATVAVDKARRTGELAGAPAAASFALSAAPALAPVAMGNFEGIRSNGSIPFDATLAVGPSHALLAVNTRVAIHSKSDGRELLNRSLERWFANVVTGATVFDPKALYDQHAGRWVLLAVAFRMGVGPNRAWFLLSISQSEDPLGPWWNYALDAAVDNTTKTTNWADYPGLGVDNQALYLTANMFPFDPDGDFQYVKIRVVPKARPYAGKSVVFRDIVRLRHAGGSLAFTLQPCHTFGAPGEQYFVSSRYPTPASPNQRALSLWALTDPTGTPSLTRRTITTDPFALPPDATQKGSSTPLDSGDIRLQNAVSRGGSVWTALTTRHDWGDGTPVAAAHWFQINPGTGQLVQQGIFGARNRHYSYPAVMPDGNGNMTMVFCRSGSSEFASIRYTGRLSTDPLGRLQTSELLKAGVARHVGLDSSDRNRWGDYNGIAVDPNDGRTAWFYSGFAVTAATEWGSWVGSSRF